jgi:hypothetical protein
MQGSPEIVAINMHGSNQAIHINSENKEYITSTGNGKTNKSGVDAMNVSDLPIPKANISGAELQLNTCSSNDPLQYPMKGSKYTLAESFIKYQKFQSLRTSGVFGVSYNSDGSARPQYYMPWSHLYNGNIPNADKSMFDMFMEAGMAP